MFRYTSLYMRQQLLQHRVLIILTGILVGTAIILFLYDPLHKFSGKEIHNIQKTVTTEEAPVSVKQWEFPGGGRALLPKHRLIALYGNFESKALGSLGEQSPEQAIQRIKEVATQHQAYANEVIYPAFELITTIASASATENGDYSRETPIDNLRAIIEMAKTHGVYVVLDLQPGHTDFLTQAQAYEELLREPHVGLALDPEWRLKPGQKHMKQVGSVTAAEIHTTAQWLADLTKNHSLPQKLFLLHQFKLSMITERETLDTSRPELAWVIQMDGFGQQNVKQDTWRAVRANSPAGIYWGWKNFIDEDKPMLSPEQTMTQIDPKPFFVSYQ